jgi:hypothetical protein
VGTLKLTLNFAAFERQRGVAAAVTGNAGTRNTTTTTNAAGGSMTFAAGQPVEAKEESAMPSDPSPTSIPVEDVVYATGAPPLDPQSVFV